MLNVNNINKQTINSKWLGEKNISLDVLRLDKVHPVVSGNKWFKLKYYLQEAKAKNCTVATFGGAWSNHIVATAFACKQAELESVGIIRGERPAVFSETLKAAEQFGMKLYFTDRSLYRDKELVKQQYGSENFYWINEGGYGATGARGAAEILNLIDTSAYSDIIVPVGTGTTLAGFLLSAQSSQRITGISSMKGNYALHQEVLKLTGPPKQGASFEILHDYHFGGYGKHPQVLLDFINETYRQHQLPLDIIYTGKTFYAIRDIAGKNYFPLKARLLLIHTGGLQGNSSLPPKVLVF